MNAPRQIDAVDGIEPGRRLIRVDADKGVSLSERLANHFHRLAWRTPLHALRLRGRYPLKLLGVPQDPIPGDIAEGNAILAGRISLRGEAIELAELDFAGLSVSAALSEHLHAFAWLRDLAAAATRQAGAGLAEKILGHWLAVHGAKVAQPAWRPDLCARRILNWACYAPMILSSNDLVYRSAVLNGLARQARHLDRSADKAPRGLPRVTAWSGVIAAGLLIPGGEGRRLHGEAGMVRALAQAQSADGGLFDRSPLSQLELVERMAQLMAVYAMRRIDPPEALAAALAKAVPALLGVTLGDGGLSSWQGSGPISALRVDAAIRASGIRTRPLRQSADWGYHRLSAGQIRLVFDAAPPPVTKASGAAASTLAFELSDGPHRIIVNCGGPAGGASDFPPALADALRATAAHSTLVIADTNSTATYPDGSLGKGVAEVAVDRQERDGGSIIEATHDGYVRRFGFEHRRRLVLGDDGRELLGEDVLLPVARRRLRSQVHPVAVRFHLAPGAEVTLTADNQGALIRIEGGPLWQFRCKGGTLALEDSLWVDEQGWPRMTQQLVIGTEVPTGGLSLSWILRRAG